MKKSCYLLKRETFMKNFLHKSLKKGVEKMR
jgi:hypothetical protein